MIKQYKDNPEYFISDTGEVYRVTKLKLSKHRKGYKRVRINYNGKRVNEFVHRIVIKTFTEIKITVDDQINHKNKVRHDNRLENLEIVTALENTFHRDNFQEPF